MLLQVCKDTVRIIALAIQRVTPSQADYVVKSQTIPVGTVVFGILLIAVIIALLIWHFKR